MKPCLYFLWCLLLIKPACAGELETHHFKSQTLNRTISYMLYKPDTLTRPLPVLYMLHGRDAKAKDWVDNGRINVLLDEAIAKGQLPPTMVVMPDLGNSWYVNSPNDYGNVHKAIADDLLNHIENTHQAASCREARAIGGYSMGGYGALLQAIDHPELFGAAISLSGVIRPPMPDSESERATLPVWMFDNVFGKPFDWRQFNQWNLFSRLSLKLTQTVAKKPELWLSYAHQDFPRLIEGSKLFSKQLQKASIPSTLQEGKGGHDWVFWQSSLAEALIWLGQKLPMKCTT